MYKKVPQFALYNVPLRAAIRSIKWYKLGLDYGVTIHCKNKALNAAMAKHTLPVSGESCVVVQLVEALRYKPEGRGLDSR